MATPPKGMHPEEIKSAIRQQDKNLTSLSEEWGYHRTAISLCLAQPWPNVQDRIAKFLNRAPEEIWPDRYSSKGVPKRGYRTKAKNSTPNKGCNNQYATAA